MKTQKIKLILASAIGILGFIALVYYIVDSILDDVLLKKEYSYTISHKISIGGTNKVSGTDNKYSFTVSNTWYVGFTSLPLKRDGTKYFIKFYPKNPNRNEATRIVADSIDVKNLPPNGYKELPHQ